MTSDMLFWFEATNNTSSRPRGRAHSRDRQRSNEMSGQLKRFLPSITFTRINTRSIISV